MNRNLNLEVYHETCAVYHPADYHFLCALRRSNLRRTGKERPGYATNHIIVKYKTHLDSKQVNSAQARIGNKLHELDPHTRLVSVDPGKPITQSIAEAQCDPDVEYAEPDYIRHSSVIPNDPYYQKQWGLADMSAPEAWSINSGSSSVIIAIIDSGVNSNHPDLAPNTSAGWDFINDRSGAMDMFGHGTAVAGIAAGRGNNGTGISGTSWGSRIMPLRASDFLGEFTSSTTVMAIDYAISRGAKIISASYSGEGYSQSEYEAISRANSAGVLFVASAGNNAWNLDSRPVYPAAYGLPNMITVASVDPDGNLSSFSNCGVCKVHLAAPGRTYGPRRIQQGRYLAPISIAALNFLPWMAIGCEPDLITTAPGMH